MNRVRKVCAKLVNKKLKRKRENYRKPVIIGLLRPEMVLSKLRNEISGKFEEKMMWVVFLNKIEI